VAAVPDGAAVGHTDARFNLLRCAILGCLAAGRPYVALDSRYPVKRNSEIIEQAGMSALVVDARSLTTT